MTEPGKRKLKLMNEVLPDPRANAVKPQGRPSSARTRTLAHLQRLLAASAAIALADCSRGMGYGVVDPMPGPADPDAGAPPDPLGRDAATAAASATAVPTAPPPSSMGYGVVDPMPPPACPEVQPQIEATATWTTTNGQKTLTLRAKATHGKYALAFGTVNDPSGAKILSRSVSPKALTVVLLPDPNAATSGLFVPIEGTCDARILRATFAIENLNGAREGGPHVEVQTY